MAYNRKWKPSKAAKAEYMAAMENIDSFCRENGIHASKGGDSYYFELNGKNYRVSNHSIEASNAKAYNFLGEQVREKYHDDTRAENTIYIHAGKTRIIEIYTDLKNGIELDGRGYRKI